MPRRDRIDTLLRKGSNMKKQTKNNWLFTGIGFLAGTAGIAAITSETAKKGYVKVVASGMRAKNAYLDICEQAKAEVDDIVAEASYITTEDAAKANA